MFKLTTISLVAAGALLASPSSDQWSASLQPVNGSAVSGTATAEGIGSADSTVVKITIRGATPNAVLPWHIHSGSCAAPGAVFGAESAYARLRTNGTGAATSTTTLASRPVKAAAYAVQVHGGAKPPTDVVSCGDLRPVLNKMPPD